MMETLTDELVREAGKIISEVEALGGMTKAIVSGMPKMRIEESAARRQAKIDSGAEVIVGVNKYRLAQEEHNFDVLEIDNSVVRKKQVERINQVKANRDAKKCKEALEKLTECAKTGKGNMLELAVEAARQRATVGEISDALEVVFGRHVAKDSIVRGAYASQSSSAPKGKNDFDTALANVKAFAK
mmetsp:Transcript_22031/g.16418  ORF Transcript_22031/g.16418 Transcript_22031/m.16418 type:complete len:186 (-) Transcript_22031:432-989(-)